MKLLDQGMGSKDDLEIVLNTLLVDRRSRYFIYSCQVAFSDMIYKIIIR